MASDFTSYYRLEPYPNEHDWEAGFSAAVHDPLWLLGRQWQMGEHQGENASSPVWVEYRLSSRPIQSSDPRFDPVVMPAEAIVESEIKDWWTLGRRVRIGQRLKDHPAIQNKKELLLYFPPPPYDHFHQQPDGRALWELRGTLGIEDHLFGAAIPADSIPAWNSQELLYQQTGENAFSADGCRLTVQRHKGGRMDWYSVNASPGASLPGTRSDTGQAVPAALQYTGAPHSRWWEIENSAVDIGGYVPDSAHTPTAFLTELIFSHSDDWFLFPILAKAGHIVAIENMKVTDAFARTYGSDEAKANGEPLWPGLLPPEQWTLFQVEGLEPKDLVLWHVAEHPLESLPLERVQWGPDEGANLVWAVECIVDGREVGSRPAKALENLNLPRFNEGTSSGDTHQAREYAYVPAEGIVPYWHPYEIDEVEGQRKLVQRRLPDLSRQKPVLMPAPEALTLQSNTPGALHQVMPSAIPSNGIQVERRWQLARDMQGNPVLWIQRQRQPLLSPPARRLRFDVLEAAADGAPEVHAIPVMPKQRVPRKNVPKKSVPRKRMPRSK